MPARLDVLKTYKLFIDGKFPRSESGRSTVVTSPKGKVLAHVCRASRKDLRDAVEAARKAQAGWQASTAYLRGQILYRIAEMMEGKRDELARAIDAVGGAGRAKGRREVDAAIDRTVHYAGWADKVSQVLGCHNSVAGPYYNFTFAEPTGVVAVVAPEEAPLLGLLSLMVPALVPGNSVVVLASAANPLPAAVLGEAMQTGDVPGGVVNILTGERAELLAHIASHRDIDAIIAGDTSPAEAATLRGGAAENVKRVVIHGDGSPRGGRTDWFDDGACQSPWWIESLTEMKTVWHPSSV